MKCTYTRRQARTHTNKQTDRQSDNTHTHNDGINGGGGGVGKKTGVITDQNTVWKEDILEAPSDRSKAPNTNFDIDIGSIPTHILTRVNEALSQTDGVEEGGDKGKCFVQQVLPAVVTPVALAVEEAMKSFLK